MTVHSIMTCMLRTVMMVCDSYHAVAPNIRHTISLSDVDGANFIQLKFNGINNCSLWLVSFQSVIMNLAITQFFVTHTYIHTYIHIIAQTGEIITK